LRDIHDTTGLTTIFVTHDQEEALDLADRVAIMNHGIIEQIGAPAEIYEKPETPFVFDFLGRTNAFDCVIEHGKAQLGDKQIPVERGIPDGPGVAFVRPHDIVLARADAVARSRDARLPGVAMVRFMSQLGQRVSVELLYEKRLIEAETSREKLTELSLARGDRCIVSLRLPRIYPRREAERQTGISERTAARPRLRRRLRERLIGTTE
jgi:sulfate/thiosulfate transport system ATP-binding protein